MKVTKKQVKKALDNSFRMGIIAGFLLAILFVLICFAGLMFYQEGYFEKVYSNSFDGKEGIIKNCQNMSLVKSSECVKLQVMKIFNYNISNVGKELSFDELVEQGGVCSHYSDLYCSVGKELGFYTKDVIIRTGYDEEDGKRVRQSHKFCIWSNEKNYVVLDQKTLFKFTFA